MASKFPPSPKNAQVVLAYHTWGKPAFLHSGDSLELALTLSLYDQVIVNCQELTFQSPTWCWPLC